MTVFLSHAWTDRQLASALAAELRHAGIEVWLDCDSIPPGDHWDRAVELALAQSGTILVILTPAAVASPNIRDEIAYAIDSGKRVLPLLYEKCDVPLRLRRLQYVDCTGGDRESALNIAEILRNSSQSSDNDTSQSHQIPASYATCPLCQRSFPLSWKRCPECGYPGYGGSH